MTEKELKQKLSDIKKQEKEEIEALKKSGVTYMGLDGHICSKYNKMIKELFEEYEKTKN